MGEQSTSITYRVSVSAQLSDESGGELYAMLWTSNVESSTIVTSAASNKSNMIELGSTGAGSSSVTANITSSFVDQAAFQSNITDPLEPGVSYYLYMYAKDVHGNETVLKHSDAIKLNTESTTVEANTSLLFGLSNNEQWQTRDTASITQPNISSTSDVSDNYFGFFDRETKTEYADVLYANIEVFPGEFAIGNVYSFALESNVEVADNLSSFSTLIQTIDEPAKQYDSVFSNSETFSHMVNKFYTSVDVTVPTSMAFGKTYTLYHACHLKGIDKMLVKRSDQVVTGTPPTILNSSASITAS